MKGHEVGNSASHRQAEPGLAKRRDDRRSLEDNRVA